jgi:hypothetical protein
MKGTTEMATSPSVLEELAGQFDPELGVAMAKWFGKPCLKAGGNVFVVQWGKHLAFKLAGEAHTAAL